MHVRKPEVLAPAGSPEALQAAVAAGADAVYFGLTEHNARIRARNFELGDLPGILADLRRWGVRSYLTFNTLIFTEEWEAARATLEAIAEAGPDGIIVQDLGVARLVREIAPGLPVHASTQMTLSSVPGLQAAARLGISRVILARELTLRDIARITREVREQALPIECEVFVHGALCVSWSGQCLSSEAWGGRSANRGQCAQACRLPYELLVDGIRKDMGDRAYLLSPRDLEAWKRVPELLALGIAAFKIEGRMKSPEYVAAATDLYRTAVDRAWESAHPLAQDASRPGETGPACATSASLPPLVAEVRQIFSRGASEGFLGGIDHQRLVDGTTRSHRGLRAGRVLRVLPGRNGAEAVLLREERPDPDLSPVFLDAGDGVLFAVSALEEDEVGGRIAEVEETDRDHEVVLRFPRESMPDLSRVAPGTPVYRTSSPPLLDELRYVIARPERARQVPVRIRVEGRAGGPLRVQVTDPEGRVVQAESQILLAEAVQSALDLERLESQLGRLGETRYHMEKLESALERDLFLPVSELNRVRREAVERLEAVRSVPAAGAACETGGARDGASSPAAAHPAEGAAQGAVHPAEGEPDISPIADALTRAVEGASGSGLDPSAAVGARAGSGAGQADSSGTDGFLEQPHSDAFEDRFVVLCRTRAQVEGALGAGVRRIALDFLDLVGLKETSAELHALGIRRTLCLPRVQKPGEERIEPFFLGLAPEEILARNLGSVERLRSLRAGAGGAGAFLVLAGDVSLNAVNPRAIEVLCGFGLDRIAPGLDLNGEQIEILLAHTDPRRIEVPVHHQLPVFHTEHCVFAAFLSAGADYRTCGRPCDRHQIALRDRTGQAHPVIADVGCRNTVFGERPQRSLRQLASYRRAGAALFRIELVAQDASAAAHVISEFRDAWGETSRS